VLSKSTATGPRLIGSKNRCCCYENTAGLSALGAFRIYFYVISKVIADDTEVVPPRQISPVNDDKPFLMRCINMLVTQRSSRARHCPAPQPSA